MYCKINLSFDDLCICLAFPMIKFVNTLEKLHCYDGRGPPRILSYIVAIHVGLSNEKETIAAIPLSEPFFLVIERSIC